MLCHQLFASAFVKNKTFYAMLYLPSQPALNPKETWPLALGSFLGLLGGGAAMPKARASHRGEPRSALVSVLGTWENVRKNLIRLSRCGLEHQRTKPFHLFHHSV